MKASSQFINLVREHARLCHNLLPREFNLTGDYPEDVLTRTLAYCILCHAEMESYLEDRALEVALNAKKSWDERGKVCKTLLGLLAFSGQDIEEPPNAVNLDTPEPPRLSEDKIQLTKRIDVAMNVFYYAVKKNNGIKEKNIHRLLLPIGVAPSDIDPILIADMNSFAEQRGEIAHLSWRKYRATQQINPQNELRKIKSIISRIIKIDQCINILSSEIS